MKKKNLIKKISCMAFMAALVLTLTGTFTSESSYADEDIEDNRPTFRDSTEGELRHATNSSGDVFLGNAFIEVGISKHGSYGTTSTPPASFNSHSTRDYNRRVGLLSAACQSASPSDDFFLPGTPEERYIVAYYYQGGQYNNCVADRMNLSTNAWITPPTATDISDGEKVAAQIVGITGQNLKVTQIVEFGPDDMYFLTTVTYENLGNTTLSNVRYVRSFDPDQDAYTYGNYRTYNRVLSNPSPNSYVDGTDAAMVVAKGGSTRNGFFFVAFDQRARASRGVSFSPNSAYLSGLWYNNTTIPTDPTTVDTDGTVGYTMEDNAIALTFDLGSLAPGESTSFSFYSSLDPDVTNSLKRLKRGFATVVIDMDDGTIAGFDQVGTYEITTDADEVIYVTLGPEDGAVPLMGIDDDGRPYNLAGKEVSILLKGYEDLEHGIIVEDSESQVLQIPEQCTFGGKVNINHGSLNEVDRLYAAIIHLERRQNDDEFTEIATRVVIFNKNKKTQQIPYGFGNLWVEDLGGTAYEYRALIDAEWYSGGNVYSSQYLGEALLTTDVNFDLTYTAIPTDAILRTTIIYDDNGGSGGPGALNINGEQVLPETVDIPSRIGYDFMGYYKTYLGDVQYYNPSGIRQPISVPTDKPWTTATHSASYTLYANWAIHYSTVYLDLNASDASYGEGGASSYYGAYSSSVKIPNPTRPGYTFLFWIADSGNGTVMKKFSSIEFEFGPDTTDVHLKAVWYDDREGRYTFDESVPGGDDGTGYVSNIAQVFRTPVNDDDKGLTEADLLGTEVYIDVYVDPVESTKLATASALIETYIAEETTGVDEAIAYYDITVEKTVDGVTTNLTEIPTPVIVRIPLTGELADKPSYAVYRVHEGNAELVSMSSKNSEYYEVTEDEILIHCKKFSVYAVTTSHVVISGDKDMEPQDGAGNVFGKVVYGLYDPIYKIDIAWGNMIFDFTKEGRWDPYKHVYEYNIYLNEDTAYDGINNKIQLVNHSNSDVSVDMYVIDTTGFDGVSIYVLQTNTGYDASEIAEHQFEDVVVAAVPYDDGDTSHAYGSEGYVRFAAMLNETSTAALVAITDLPGALSYARVGTVGVFIDGLATNLTPLTHVVDPSGS